MKIIFLILLSLTVNASDILTNYRTHGLQDIEKKMDLELAKKEYWSEFLEGKDTTFGYLETFSSVLTCNKEKSTLVLYKQNKNKKFEFAKDYSAFTGKMKGDKMREGDLTTPLGVYEITKKLSKVDSFYGPLAFVTSYPNTYDRYRGRGGSGIWIHGLPTDQKRDDYTKGCIAINNPSLECLDRRIDIENTMLIINSGETKKDVPKKILAELLAQLYAWRYAWLYNDIQTYLGFYAPDFMRDDGMSFSAFTTYKKRVFGKSEKKTIIFDRINVVPYPSAPDMYQISFKEVYSSDTLKFVGEKTLMVKLAKDNKFKIFTENQ